MMDESCDFTIFASRKGSDGQFIARRLARSEVAVCASPEYPARRGYTQHPRALRSHEVMIPRVALLQREQAFLQRAYRV